MTESTHPPTYLPDLSLPTHPPPYESSCTIANVKILLEAKTRVLPEKQKLIGLNIKGGKAAPDGTTLADLALKGKRPFKFMLMGTPEVGGWVGWVGGWVGRERARLSIHPRGWVGGWVGGWLGRQGEGSYIHPPTSYLS